MSIKNTILVIGATSGIGRALTRSIHAQGKKVIATGRNQARLSSMTAELPGLETSCFDFSDIHALPTHVSGLMKKYPDIDTVIVNAGIQNLMMFKDADPEGPQLITKEVTTNVTAPIVFCQQLVPYFLNTKKPCSIILMSSGLALVPVFFLPVYCPTKAAIHAFAIALRAQLVETNVTVTEVFPQYVETELDKEHKQQMVEVSGGPDKAPKAMPLDAFTEQVIVKLDALEGGKPLKEIAVGAFPEAAVAAWREAMGPWVERFGRGG
jgi:short-subunit dehydrogenase involved in D-alanine esterification of teichoic acids